MEFILKALLIVIIGGGFGLIEAALFPDEPVGLIHKVVTLTNGSLLILVLQWKVS